MMRGNWYDKADFHELHFFPVCMGGLIRNHSRIVVVISVAVVVFVQCSIVLPIAWSDYIWIVLFIIFQMWIWFTGIAKPVVSGSET